MKLTQGRRESRGAVLTANCIPTARFRIGRIVATYDALAVLSESDISQAIARHQAGDWGDLSGADRRANDEAVLQGTRLLSAYCSAKGVKFRILTEADRLVTTILLPHEY